MWSRVCTIVVSLLQRLRVVGAPVGAGVPRTASFLVLT